MKILRKTISLTILILILMLMFFDLICNTLINTFASSSLNTNNRKIVNVAVLLYSFDDPFLIQVKQSLEDIQKENKDKVRFTFYDGKNNIAIQSETLDSILRDNVDLIIGNLADTSENFVEDIILTVKKKNVPLILENIDPQVVSKVSKYYDKVAFVLSDSAAAGIAQGKILVNLWNTNKSALDKNGDNILQYILLHGEIDNPAAIDRTKYAISAINDSGIKTQQLALINANWLKELANSSISSLFLKYGDSIEAIISNNDAMAIGAIGALQKYGYNKGDNLRNIAVVGIDALPEARELVDKGFMTGTVVQDPKVSAVQLYTIGMNLINNENPIENTNYKIVDGEIITPFTYEEYIKKANTQ